MSEPSTELTVVVDPLMGEVLDLPTASCQRLAQLLLDLREHEQECRSIKSAISEEIHKRFDRSRVWSLTTDEGLKLSGQSDAMVVEWNVPELMEELDAMVQEGLLTPEAVGKAIRVTVDYKVMANGIGALLKSHVFAERLAPFKTEVEPANRRVTVSRAT